MSAPYKTLYALLAFTGGIALLAGTLFWLSPAIAQEATTRTALSPEVLKAGYWAAALATGLLVFAWLLVHRFRVAYLTERAADVGLDDAIAERRAEGAAS